MKKQSHELKAEVEKINKLESKLKKLNNLKLTCVGFVIFEDEENGANIGFRKKMPVEDMGVYEGDRVENINWPYTGFVAGSLLGWSPIGTLKIIDSLKQNGYTVDDFTKRFCQNLRFYDFKNA